MHLSFTFVSYGEIPYSLVYFLDQIPGGKDSGWFHHDFKPDYFIDRGLARLHSGKESACQCKGHKRHRFDPWVRKIPWRRK